MNNTPPTPPERQTETPSEVPLVERLRSVPKDWREMRQIGECAHRNVPYGAMLNEAADRITALQRELTAATEAAKAYGERLVADLTAANFDDDQLGANDFGPDGYECLDAPSRAIAEEMWRQGHASMKTAIVRWLEDRAALRPTKDNCAGQPRPAERT